MPASLMCQKCNSLIGDFVTVNESGKTSLVALRIGGVAARTVHGVCLSCGAEFHWSTSDRLLAALLRQMRVTTPRPML